MTTVGFVHGINTRGEAYDSAFARIRDALARCRPDVALRPCRWGGGLGALLKGQGQSIPRYDQTIEGGEITVGVEVQLVRGRACTESEAAAAFTE